LATAKAHPDSLASVLICVDSFLDGGAEMFAIRLANHLATSARVCFITLRPWLTKNNKQHVLLDYARVSVIALTGNSVGDIIFNVLLRLSRFSWTLYKLAMDWRLLFVCKVHRIQIVHSHSWETDEAFAALKSRGGFRLVSTLHGHYELPHDDQQSKRQLESADAIVYLSPQQLVTLEKYAVPAVKRSKIFNGIPFQLARLTTTYQSHEKLRLVMAARGIPEKGWAETLEAVAAIHCQLGDVVTIDLLGAGEVLNRLQQKYEGHTYIRFWGYCQNVMPIVQQAHIGLLPSYFEAESLPNSISEYLTCGKPAIATDVGAIREMLTDDGDVAGIVLSLDNGRRALSEQVKNAILEYVWDADRVSRDSAIALRAAQKFQMQACVERYLELYKNVLR
jgi:glycosyltransferase involved in cell wall biosynthesis